MAAETSPGISGAPLSLRLWDATGAGVRWTGQEDGDMAGPDTTEVRARRRRVIDLPWTVLRQVHGADVVTVDAPGAGSGREADAAVTAIPGAALAVLTADCAPVALASREGVVGVAHAGWRGLVAGVVEATVGAMRSLGATRISAVLGPCIHAECYAFGPGDLDVVASCYGGSVRALTADGRPALDLPAAVGIALQRAGASLDAVVDRCTACSPGLWSWRARRDDKRQSTAVWLR